MVKKAMVSLSGGMDSATVLTLALRLGREVQPVIFSYGSKHGVYEQEAAGKLCDHYGLRPFRVDFSRIAYMFKSSLLKHGGPIPEGHYEADNMKQTVVPGRNLIFLSILSGLAWSHGASEIYIGAHSGDHHIYPDCRPEFFRAMQDAVYRGTDGNVTVCAPYLFGNKTTILKDGFELGVPYELTRTCYKDQPVACGVCGSCQERLEAFVAHGVVDPIPYENR